MKKILSLLALSCISMGAFAESYTIKLNGVTIGSMEAASQSEVEANIPDYVSYSWDGNTLNSNYNANIPFTLGKKTIVYFQNGNNKYFWNDSNEGVGNEIRWNGNPTDITSRAGLQDKSNFTWFIEGDWYNGFTFRNAVTSKTITAPSTLSAQANFLLDDNAATAFVTKKLSDGNYRLYIKGQSTYYLAHTSHGSHRVTMYNVENYGAGYVKFEADLQETIDDVIAKKNCVGYPADMSSIEAYGNNGLTSANFDAAQTALTALYANTDIAINLPEDGKAYYMVNYQMVSNNNQTLDGNKWMMKYNDDHTLGTVAYTGQEPDASNIFYCRKIGDKYTFVTKDGYYLRHYSGDHKGALSESYDANQILTIQKHIKESNFVIPSTDKFFGFVAIRGNRNGSANACIIVNGQNGYYDNTSGMLARYNAEDNQYSTAWRMIEVENPNKLKLTNPNPTGTSGLDNKYVGTFSAPYNVELPAGVKAYKASVDGSIVTFTEIGNVVPKNVGVLVYKEDATENVDVAAVPAISTTTVEGNALQPANGTIAAGTYVLGKGSHGVGFYARQTPTTVANKAYLEVPAGSNLSAFRFDFEDTITGIEAVESNAATTVFDLQGRRVQGGKAGLYIVNGKKVIR